MTFLRFFTGLVVLLFGQTLYAETKPNFVFILVDDLRWNALGCMGDKVVQTPHIDQIARDGTLFKNAFVTTSICSVSRASIFTGQWMRRHSIADFKTGLTDAQWQNSYPGQLKGAGYKLGFVGKFGVGDSKEIKLKASAFDYWRGDEGQGGKFFIDPNDPNRTHKTTQFGNDALEFLNDCEQGKPFSLSVSFNAVHARDKQPREFEPDIRDESLYKDVTIPLPPTANDAAFEKIPHFVQTSEGRTRWHYRFESPEKAQQILRDYYRLITGVDREVGRIRQVLEERGLADNTIIIFTSDNGFALGDRGLADKWFMWEEDIRVPLLIYDPRIAAADRVKESAAMVLNVDLAPTMLAMAGIVPPENMQGESLAPLLQKSATTSANWRTEFFYEHHSVPTIIPQVEGVRTEKWKYIRWIASDPLVEEFYDLENDPLEQNNLIRDEKHASELASLRERWSNYGQVLK